MSYSLYHVSHGAGRPVVLVHGVASSHHDWEALLPALEVNGFCSYTVDLLGHGDSPQPRQPEAYSGETFYQSLADWASGLSLDEPAVWVGHSLGGYFSLLHALRSPEQVRGLVLIDPLIQPGQVSAALRWVARWPRLAALALPLAPLWLLEVGVSIDYADTAHLPRPARRQTALDAYRSSPKNVYLFSSIEDLLPEAGRVKTPALVLWGEGDFTLNPAVFPRLCAALPNAMGRSFSGCRHQPHRKEPQAVAEAVVEFLRGL